MSLRPPVLDHPAGEEVPPAPEVLFKEARRRRRRRWTLGLAVVIVALTFASIGYGAAGNEGIGLHQSSPHADAASHPVRTRWRRDGKLVIRSGTPGNYAGFSPVETITCAGLDATTCFIAVEANGVLPDGRSVTPRTLVTSEFRSTDAGRSWRPLTLPSNAWVSTAFSCPTAHMCAVGAAVDMHNSFRKVTAVVLTTNNAGKSWMLHRLPESAGLVRTVDCPTTSECVVATWRPTATWVTGMTWNDGPTATFPSEVFSSKDAGKTWSELRLPRGPAGDVYSLGDLVCPTAVRCLLAGSRRHVTVMNTYTSVNHVRVYQSSTGVPLVVPLDLRTGTATVGVRQGGPTSCVSEGRCLMLRGSHLYTSSDAGRMWKTAPGRVPQHASGGTLHCTSATSCVIIGGEDIATTNDGGRRWELQPDPDLYTASCTASGICVGLQFWRSPSSPTVGGQVETNAPRIGRT